jgi:hypothetical protein
LRGPLDANEEATVGPPKNQVGPRPQRRRPPHMLATIASPNSEHFKSFAPVISRSRS